MMKSIAIIGAGIAGITLARQLQGSADARVFEKSRGIGGRMSTRRSGSYQFDHGAQFFTARSASFRSLIGDYLNQDRVNVWEPRVLTLDPDRKPYKREWFEPHYVATQGMNDLAKALAGGIEISLETKITAIEPSNQGWLLRDSANTEIDQFDWVVLALPAPQAMELLPEQFEHRAAITTADFSPCFSLMLGFESALKLKFDACVVRNSSIGWIAVDSSKRSSSFPNSLVVHSDNAWARTRLGVDIDEVRDQMLADLSVLLGDSLPEAEHIAIHRWKYAKAEASCEQRYFIDDVNKLALCGDWCGGNRVEDAYLSGFELGSRLAAV